MLLGVIGSLRTPMKASVICKNTPAGKVKMYMCIRKLTTRVLDKYNATPTTTWVVYNFDVRLF